MTLSSYLTMSYAVLLGILLAGCATTPPVNTNLVEAQESFEAARQDAEVIQNAPVALEEAHESLKESERLWRSGADQEIVSQKAYIANKRVQIAREKAAANAAEKAVNKAEAERREVLLQSQRDKSQSLAKQLEELKTKKTDRGSVLTLGDVLFDVNKANLKAGGINVIERLAAFLSDYPDRKVLIEGFTDSTGTVEHNQVLSEQRARAVEMELIKRGTSRSRISTVGYGIEFPVAGNETSAGRQMNRRVEVVISDDSGQISHRRN